MLKISSIRFYYNRITYFHNRINYLYNRITYFGWKTFAFLIGWLHQVCKKCSLCKTSRGRWPTENVILHNISWCSCHWHGVVCLELLLFLLALDFEFWGSKQKSFQICKRIFSPMTHFCFIVDFYVNAFLNASSEVVPLLTYYAEILHWCAVACAGLVLIYGWKCLEIFLKPFTKCFSPFPNVSPHISPTYYIRTFG